MLPLAQRGGGHQQQADGDADVDAQHDAAVRVVRGLGGRGRQWRLAGGCVF